MTTDQRFRPREHVRRAADFARAFADGRRAGNDALVVYVIENTLEWPRLGLSVGKRAGNAVRRNYIRRRIREAFRTSKSGLPPGLDIICVARPLAGDPQYDLESAFRTLVRKAIRRPRRARQPKTHGGPEPTTP